MPNYNITPLDQDPRFGAELLNAVIQGQQMKMERARQHRETGLQNLQLLASIYGPGAAASALPSLGVTPPAGAQPIQSFEERQQKFISGLEPGAKFAAEGQLYAPGTFVTPKEQMQAQRQDLLALGEMFGGDIFKQPQARSRALESWGFIPSGPTIGEKGLKLQQEQQTIAREQLRSTIVQGMVGKFEPKLGPDLKPLSTPEETQELVGKVYDYIEKGLPIPKEALEKLTTSDRNLSMMLNKRQLSPKTQGLLDLFATVSTLRDNKKNWLPGVQKQAEAIYQQILASPEFGGQAGALPPDPKGAADAVTGGTGESPTVNFLDWIVNQNPLAKGITRAITGEEEVSGRSRLTKYQPRIDAAVKRLQALGIPADEIEAQRADLVDRALHPMTFGGQVTDRDPFEQGISDIESIVKQFGEGSGK